MSAKNTKTRFNDTNRSMITRKRKRMEEKEEGRREMKERESFVERQMSQLQIEDHDVPDQTNYGLVHKLIPYIPFHLWLFSFSFSLPSRFRSSSKNYKPRSDYIYTWPTSICCNKSTQGSDLHYNLGSTSVSPELGSRTLRLASMAYISSQHCSYKYV